MRPWWLALAALAVGFPRHAAAEVAITVDATAAATTVVTVRATNSGPGAVRDIVPEVRLRSTSRRGDAVPALGDGDTHVWSVTLPAPDTGGTYGVVARVAYVDARGTAASAVGVGLVATSGAPDDPVTATLAVQPIDTHGAAALTLVNPTPALVAGRVHPVLPSELGTDPETFPAQVLPGGCATATFVLENDGAEPGRTLPLWALFEYERDGLHRTVVAGAALPIVPRRAAGTATPILVCGASLAVAGALLALAWRRTAR
jgi:hypothetical protein